MSVDPTQNFFYDVSVRWVVPIFFLFGSIVSAEVILRIYHGRGLRGIYHAPSFPPTFEFDKKLGWRLRTGEFVEKGIKCTIGPDGIRSNQNNLDTLTSDNILAVGASFTYGGGVRDSETWPSALERTRQTRVINAGVSAYALDQIWLRFEELAQKFSPSISIFSFTPDNISWVKKKTRAGRSKPYFTLVDAQLSLKNSPVPTPEEQEASRTLIEKFTIRSEVINSLVKRLMPLRYRTMLDVDNVEGQSSGVETSCRIMEKLRHTPNPVLVMVQYDKELQGRDLAMPVIRCAEDFGLDVLDLYESFLNVQEKNTKDWDAMFLENGHMSPKGNEFVANQLAIFLDRASRVPSKFKLSRTRTKTFGM